MHFKGDIIINRNAVNLRDDDSMMNLMISGTDLKTKNDMQNNTDADMLTSILHNKSKLSQ